MGFDLKFFLFALKSACAQIPITLWVALSSMLIGIIMGLLIALVRFFRIKLLSPILRYAVTIIRGVPVILILFIFYVTTAYYFNPVMDALHISIRFSELNKSIIAIAAFSVASTAYLAEVFRGSLTSVKKGQFDAGFSVGLSGIQLLKEVILPQAIPVALPMLCNVVTSITKATTLATMISVVDVLNGALIPATSSYRFFESYIAAALVYWMICVLIEMLFAFLKKKTSLVKVEDAT
jgi:L-cystine transport system permease protein